MSARRRQSGVHRTGCAVKTAVLVASLVAGATLMAVAGGSGGYGWMGWFALVPLFLGIRLCRPVGAMLGGALWGLTFSLASAVVPLVGPANEAPVPFSFSFSVIMLLAAIPAIYAGLAACLTRWIGFSPFALGVGWMGVELALRPLGLDLGLLAATQSDCALLNWVGRALGYMLVAFAVAYVNALILEALSSLPIPTPRSIIRSASGDFYRSLLPQRSSYFPRFALQPSQPRAPPAPGPS